MTPGGLETPQLGDFGVVQQQRTVASLGDLLAAVAGES